MKKEFERPEMEVFFIEVKDSVMDSGQCPTYDGAECPMDGYCMVDGSCLSDYSGVM